MAKRLWVALWVAFTMTVFSTSATACPVSLWGYTLWGGKTANSENSAPIKTPTERAIETAIESAKSLFANSRITDAEIRTIAENQKIFVPEALRAEYEQALALMEKTVADRHGEVKAMREGKTSLGQIKHALLTVKVALRRDILSRSDSLGPEDGNALGSFKVWDVLSVVETVGQLEAVRASKERAGHEAQFASGTERYVKVIQRKAIKSQIRVFLLEDLLTTVHDYITVVDATILSPRTFPYLAQLKEDIEWFRNTKISWTIFSAKLLKVKAGWGWGVRTRRYYVRGLAGPGKDYAMRAVTGKLPFSTVYDGYGWDVENILPLFSTPAIVAPTNGPSS